jgi:hypothetical protein
MKEIQRIMPAPMLWRISFQNWIVSIKRCTLKRSGNRNNSSYRDPTYCNVEKLLYCTYALCMHVPADVQAIQHGGSANFIQHIWKRILYCIYRLMYRTPKNKLDWTSPNIPPPMYMLVLRSDCIYRGNTIGARVPLAWTSANGQGPFSLYSSYLIALYSSYLIALYTV